MLYFGVRVLAGSLSGYDSDTLLGSPWRWIPNLAAIVVRSVTPPMPRLAWVGLALGALVVAGLAWRSREALFRMPGAPWPLAVWSLGAATCCAIPVVGLGVSPTTTAGERLTYLPSVFSAILVAALLASAVDRRPRAASGLVGAVGLLSIGLLLLNGEHWERSADLSRRFVDAETTWQQDSGVVIVNTPDSVRGAYAMRNGVRGSLALVNGWTSPDNVMQVASFSTVGPDPEITVEVGSDRRSWLFRLEGPDDAYLERGPVSMPDSSGIGAEVLGERLLRVRVDEDAPVSELWYFSRGEMRRLPVRG